MLSFLNDILLAISTGISIHLLFHQSPQLIFFNCLLRQCITSSTIHWIEFRVKKKISLHVPYINIFISWYLNTQDSFHRHSYSMNMFHVDVDCLSYLTSIQMFDVESISTHLLSSFLKYKWFFLWK